MIMGCGGLGMNAISIARAMGIENIIAVDIDNDKLDAAYKMGAAKIANNQRKNAVEKLQKMTNGRLMGVLDTFGSGATARIAVRAMSRKQVGICLLVEAEVTRMRVELPQKL